MNKILEIRSDIMFQDIFNSKNMMLMTLLLSQLLRVKKEDVKDKFVIKNVRVPRTNGKQKQKYCDYVIEFNNIYIIIELNNNYHGISTRNDTYAFSVVNSVYGKDDKTYYKKNIKTILFNLNWHYKNSDKQREKYEEEILQRSYQKYDYLLKIVNINLDYYVAVGYNKVDEFEKLFKLFTITNSEELKEATKGDEYLERYYEEVMRLQGKGGYQDMILSDIMEERLAQEEINILVAQGREEGIREGILEGKEEGILEKEQETVVNMYKDNLPLKKIAEYVNIGINKVKEIIKNNVNN